MLLRWSVAFYQMAVALVASYVDSAICDGIFYGTIALVNMATIWEATVRDVWSNVRVEGRDFFGNYVPQLELADSGCIYQIPLVTKWNQCRRCRCMTAFVVILAHRTHPQIQARLNRVEQR